jgi:hypothetical protein
LAGCAATEEPELDEAATIAEKYLTAVAGDEADFGWSLLHEPARTSWGTYEEYEQAVRSADWSAFSFNVRGGSTCYDDAACTVCVELPGGLESVPPFLRATDNKALDGLIVSSKARDCGNGVLEVVLGRLPWESDGVVVLPH